MHHLRSSLYAGLACYLICVAAFAFGITTAFPSPAYAGRPHDHLLPATPRSIFETQRGH